MYSRLPVLIAATLAATSTAIDFGGQNDITQSAGTVAPQGETTGSYDSTSQWTQTASSSNDVPTMAPSAPSTVSGSQSWAPQTSSGSQGWSQPTLSGSGQGWTPPTTTDASNSWTPTSSGTGDQGGMPLECSGSGDAQTPETGMSLECSGSSDGFNPGNDFSLACSGSDEEQASQPSVSTSTAGSSNITPTTTTAPTTSSGTGDQTGSQPSSTASSSNTATSAATGEYEDANPTTSTASSSNTATSSENGGTASTNSTSSGVHASFGTVTSKSGECVIGNPDTYVCTADIDWIWENRIGPSAPTRDANWNVMDNKNWIMDHIVANKGSLNYCVRWDSDKKLTKSVASKFQAMLERQYAAWNHWLIGYDCWPYNEIKINIVGFAVKEASLLDWSDDSLGTISVGDLDSDGVPQCAQSCYRFYDNGAGSWSDTSSCKGEPFDISLWLKQGLQGGFGYDWGQEVNLENMRFTS
ncbi:unnamed protein product [Phytophthora lilii]|uniref:Unnamed protein product n=1 Tax=Phytophthora lilii TaxID=2077276 RepID=A0A9W6XAP8_9STRA|nr:unnamed protein product [Phytophthora lilii]